MLPLQGQVRISADGKLAFVAVRRHGQLGNSYSLGTTGGVYQFDLSSQSPLATASATGRIPGPYFLTGTGLIASRLSTLRGNQILDYELDKLASLHRDVNGDRWARSKTKKLHLISDHPTQQAAILLGEAGVVLCNYSPNLKRPLTE